MRFLREMKVNEDRKFRLSPYGDAREYGLKLANLSEDQGGWKEKFEYLGDIEQRCRINPHHRPEDIIASTALMLENAKQMLLNMNEDTRAIQVGGFQDMMFPIIRAAFPSNPILDMVSVQTLTRPNGTVFFMNYVIGQAKGTYGVGQRIFDAQTGFMGGSNYSSEIVQNETIGAGDGSTLTPTLTALAYAGQNASGIRPGTVVINCLDNNGTDTIEIRDNGNGVLMQVRGSDITDLTAGTVNYMTGAVSLTFGTGDAPQTAPILATYEVNLEGSANLPTIDVQLVTSPISAQRRALRYRYSAEAQQDYAAEFGRDISEEIAAGIAATIVTEQAREVVSELFMAAGAPVDNFNIFHGGNGTANYARNEHLGDIKYPINRVMNQMYQETQRVRPNWMVVDTNMATVLQSLGAPYFFQFDRSGPSDDTLGVKYIGMWDNRCRVYVDSLLDQNPGASPDGNALFGYRGQDMSEVAYIWAPYQLAYVTPAVALDDFMTRKAMASRVGRKLVNGRLLKRFELRNSAT